MIQWSGSDPERTLDSVTGGAANDNIRREAGGRTVGSTLHRKRRRSRPTECKIEFEDLDGPSGEQGTTDDEVFAAMADLGIGVDAVGEASRETYERYLRQQKRCHR